MCKVCTKDQEKQKACEKDTEARVPRAGVSCRMMLEKWAGARCCRTGGHGVGCPCILRVTEGH